MKLTFDVWRFYFSMAIFRVSPERNCLDLFALSFGYKSKTNWLHFYKTRNKEYRYSLWILGLWANNDMVIKRKGAGVFRYVAAPVRIWGIGKRTLSKPC
jgi:hypothetical protein